MKAGTKLALAAVALTMPLGPGAQAQDALKLAVGQRGN